jgi:predicted RNase H-like nuclease (RuvC/YqgF family)
MTVLILRGSEEIKQFLRPHDKEQEIDTWTCPKCGNVNRGLYYSHEAPCPRCGEFRHPKLDARTGYPRIRAMSDRLETLRSDRSDLEDQVEGLRREIYELEEEIGIMDSDIALLERLIKQEQERIS